MDVGSSVSLYIQHMLTMAHTVTPKRGLVLPLQTCPHCLSQRSALHCCQQRLVFRRQSADFIMHCWGYAFSISSARQAINNEDESGNDTGCRARSPAEVVLPWSASVDQTYHKGFM